MYTEIKYLNLLSSRLDKFKKKGERLWNFRCPICGDSQRNKTKARGFIFEVKGKLRYKCHNCGSSLTIDNFIKELDPMLFKQYKLEKFRDSGKSQPIDFKKVKKVVSTKPVFKRSTLSGLTPIDELNNSHPAREYLLNRRLPTNALYFTESFQKWVNTVKPNTFPSTEKDEERIIIPFINREGDCFGIQGRSIHNDGLRYITILFEDGAPKIFGLNTVDYDKRIYITEGPFDSLLIKNGIAMAGADVHTDALDGCDLVYVYDNEPRNKEICKRIKSHIDRGHSVVIWPTVIKEKDINDMKLAGHNVQEIVTTNSYSGLTATLKFNDWIK